MSYLANQGPVTHNGNISVCTALTNNVSALLGCCKICQKQQTCPFQRAHNSQHPNGVHVTLWRARSLCSALTTRSQPAHGAQTARSHGAHSYTASPHSTRGALTTRQRRSERLTSAICSIWTLCECCMDFFVCDRALSHAVGKEHKYKRIFIKSHF